jgi:enolase
MTISKIRALEILDSRGNPTVSVQVQLNGSTWGQAQVPSGASTGTHEAVELRDADRARFAGKGVRIPVENVERRIAPALEGTSAEDQAAVDRRLIELDGSPDKSRLGANAILGVSCAVARAAAIHEGIPLWRRLAGKRKATIPLPMVNIISGGLHAGRNIEFQDFLAVPHGFSKFSESLEAAVAIHRAARELIETEGQTLAGVADEGGWGPRLRDNESALDILHRAIASAGFVPGEQVSIAIDAAATHLYADGVYHLSSERRTLNSAEMVWLFRDWVLRYPGIGQGVANAVLVKMNQIGTLTETFEVIDRARAAGYRAVISARSGETEDSFLADLAVASGAGQIKVGSITRSERLAKYNRLLEIEKWDCLPYADDLAQAVRRSHSWNFK